MAGIHHYGHRDRAERTPGSHDAFMAACALAALAVGCGLVVGAGLLDGLVFAGAPRLYGTARCLRLSLRYSPTPNIPTGRSRRPRRDRSPPRGPTG